MKIRCSAANAKEARTLMIWLSLWSEILLDVRTKAQKVCLNEDLPGSRIRYLDSGTVSLQSRY